MPVSHKYMFDKTVEKTQQLLHNIEEQLQWISHKGIAYAALKAVLHTLRDRLSITQSAHVSAQLPLLVRGMFYEGWCPAKVPKKMNKGQFLSSIQSQLPVRVEERIEDVVRAVATALRQFIDEGEFRKVRAELPNDIAELFQIRPSLLSHALVSP